MVGATKWSAPRHIDGKVGVVDGDPAEVEGRLLEEQEEIEFRLGKDYMSKGGW